VDLVNEILVTESRVELDLEHVSDPVASRADFYARVLFNLLMACLIIGASLGAGMVGYHNLVHLSWIDSYLNASMILSGMGPLAPCDTFWGKLFAGTYALYSGLVIVMTAGLILAPVAHRLLHKFHVECD